MKFEAPPTTTYILTGQEVERILSLIAHYVTDHPATATAFGPIIEKLDPVGWAEAQRISGGQNVQNH